MNWLDLFAGLVLFFGAIGGLTQGAVRALFSLLILLIAIPIAGAYYQLAATALSFLPGKEMENFVGFFIALAIASIILHLIFFLPRRIIQQVWKEGILYRLLGGFLNLVNAAIGLALFAVILRIFPIFDWLVQEAAGSGILLWLVGKLSFIPALLGLLGNSGRFA